MTKEEFLLDALKYYTTDINRRCIAERSGGICRYSPASIQKEGKSEGCLIGRHLSPENQIEADKIGPIGRVLQFKDKKILPEWMIELGEDFLTSCQRFHDAMANWDKEGLTPIGINALRWIITENNLNPELFTKYTN